MKNLCSYLFASIVLNLLISIPSYSQALDFSDSLFTTVFKKTVNSKLKTLRSIPINSKEIALFEFYRNDMIANLYSIDNEKISNRSKYTFDNFKNHDRLLGHVVHEFEIQLFFISQNMKVISVIKFDLINKKISEVIFHDLKKTKEVYAASQITNNSFTILSIVKNTSQLNVYKYLPNSKVETLKFDLSNHSFSNDYPQLYYKLTSPNSIPSNLILITKIDKVRVSDLASTRSFKKVYFNDKSIILTLDDDEKKTTLVNLNLESVEASIKEFEKGHIDACPNSLLYSSNSLILDQNLYQVITCRKELNLKIISLEYGKVLDEIKLDKDTINEDFQYSIFKEETGAKLLTNPKDKYTTATKILRKGVNHNIAIGLRKLQNNIVELDMGTYQEKDSTIPLLTPIIFGYVWYGYIHKSYPYNIFIRNHLNLKSMNFQEIDLTLQEKIDNSPFYTKYQNAFMLNNIKYRTKYDFKQKILHLQKSLNP